MTHMRHWILYRLNRETVEHSARMAVAAMILLLLAHVCSLAEPRWAAITTLIVMLVVRAEPAWVIAAHRFIEVSVGIAVGLMLMGLRPERQPEGVAKPNTLPLLSTALARARVENVPAGGTGAP